MIDEPTPVSQQQITKWLGDGGTMASAMEHEADALAFRAKELRAIARRVRKALPTARRARPRKETP
jgi:hypothetical protein